MNQQALVTEMQNNILVRLQMTDPQLINQLKVNPTAQYAEELMQQKLKGIGLTDKEIAIIFMRDGMKLPLASAMRETGLPQEELDKLYDSAEAKVLNFMNGGSVSDTSKIRALFNKSNE